MDVAARRFVPSPPHFFRRRPTVGRHAEEVRVPPEWGPVVGPASGHEQPVLQNNEAVVL